MILEFVLQYNPSTLSISSLHANVYCRVTVTAKVKVDTFIGKLKPKLELGEGSNKNALWLTGMIICWNNKMGKRFEQEGKFLLVPSGLSRGKESELSNFHFLSFFLLSSAQHETTLWLCGYF